MFRASVDECTRSSTNLTRLLEPLPVSAVDDINLKPTHVLMHLQQS